VFVNPMPSSSGTLRVTGWLTWIGLVIMPMRQQWGPKKAREQGHRQRPMAEQARGEPRQLLAMMQADWLIQEQRGERRKLSHDEPLREALFRSSGHPAGATGLSIESYADAAEWFSEHVPAADYIPDRISTTCTTMIRPARNICERLKKTNIIGIESHCAPS
jgi:hypothetical protein